VTSGTSPISPRLRAKLAAGIAVVNPVTRRARQGAALITRRLEQALVLVGRQTRRAVVPEPRGERVGITGERRVPPQGRAVEAERVARHERIAVRQERLDVVGDALSVAAAAQIGGARR
jgi:hypothetical protein